MSLCRSSSEPFRHSNANHGSAPAASTLSSSSLQSVAVRFQERAAELAREQSLLEQTQSKLDDLQKVEGQQNRQRAALRRDLLRARQDRDAAEEQSLILQEKAVVLRQEIQEYENNVGTFQAIMDQATGDFSSEAAESLMIPHRARRALYLEYVRGRVHSVQQSERNREAKRAKLAQAIPMLQQQRGEFDNQKRLMEREAREMQQVIVQEQAETHELSEKVRAAVAERKQLRDDLRRAKA